MPVKLMTSFKTLMQYASELGNAKKNGTPEQIAIAQKRHDDYHALCLKADGMNIGMTIGQLS